MNVNVAKIYLQSNSKDLLRFKNSGHFFSFIYLNVESLVTYPNNEKVDFLNQSVVDLHGWICIMPKNCNF